MAQKEDIQEHEPLTEEQRITALEDKVGTNKFVLLAIALFLIVTISVSITAFSMASFGDKDAAIDPEIVTALQGQVEQLTLQLEAAQDNGQILKKQLVLLQEQVSSSSNNKLQTIILEQEKGHQEFLDALRSGMYDLAHMVPGSRTWLDVYSEKIEKAEAHSKTREKTLQSLKDQATNNNDEDPFSDGF